MTESEENRNVKAGEVLVAVEDDEKTGLLTADYDADVEPKEVVDVEITPTKKDADYAPPKWIGGDASPKMTTTKTLENFVKSEEEIKKAPKKTRAFYRKQNAIIEGLKDAENLFADDIKTSAQEKSRRRKVRAMVYSSFMANVFLFALKIFASIQSGSLAVISSAIDSLLDLIAGSFLFLVERFSTRLEPYKYPEGKARVEPLGIVVFAAIMGVMSLNLIKEGVEVLITGFGGDPPALDITWVTLAILFVVIAVKVVLWCWCNTMSSESEMVEALSEDHRNDSVTNLVAAAAAIVAGEWAAGWWLDAVGAIFFGVWILVNWVQAGKERIGMLIGENAPPELIGQLTFIAGHHDDRIMRVDTVRAFHFGENFLAEIDIVLPEEMPLKESHDIGEELQHKIEKLPMIQRAYVHIDYEWLHAPEH